ncbi:tripartite tricarboxylate transporter TctB family protein [Ornithinibacillus sp. L9]|uniref:Tripartite tricarboxylate transporter TctB family protein n=1 Tax=Ornithinibacillus caprae TaxID=2678566 RepID=A0A6N8FQA2_9BACI|nr:tripartite tricarboxylate transporter TctB family protein [Ornithinibacillus caprae]MUK90159.1 tripartite tricarboxylate transporter TctB family protein [Ornithinibacillus caprae]
MLKTLNQKVSLVLLAIAAGYLLLSYQLPSYPYAIVDADVLPKGLGYLLVILVIALFFTKDSETEEQKARRNIPKKDILALLAVFAFVFFYIFLLEILGFVLTTALFIFFCSWFLGYKKHLTNIIVAVLFPLFMYFTFTEFLQISLPQGILPF